MVDTLTYIESIASEAATVWFVAMGLRKTYDVDEKLDLRSWLVRLGIIGIGIVSLCFRSPSFKYERIICGGSAIAVLAWPNLAYRISRMLDSDDPKAEGN